MCMYYPLARSTRPGSSRPTFNTRLNNHLCNKLERASFSAWWACRPSAWLRLAATQDHGVFNWHLSSRIFYAVKKLLGYGSNFAGIFLERFATAIERFYSGVLTSSSSFCKLNFFYVTLSYYHILTFITYASYIL